MVFNTIAKQAVYKGLDFVGTGDILHPKWLEMMQEELEKTHPGTYKHPEYGTKFIPTVEIEDNQKVHHLILLPSLDKAKELRKKLDPHSSDLYIDGRPHINLNTPEIVQKTKESEALIGPSHAFTPWTSIFKEHDTLKQCYKDQTKNINFLELGLSADTYMADRIDELKKLTFLSNSDAHSPWPNKLGREFNRFELSEPSCKKILESIKERKNLNLNVGLNPKLGKYHLTACSRCNEKFSIDKAKSIDWNCEKCGGAIKKGVHDRVNELADFKKPNHPDSRPNYLHIAPLSEIITLAWNRSNPRSRDIQQTWNSLVEKFNNEIKVLIDTPIPKIKKTTDQSIALMIKTFRQGNLEITPGGGGKYGELKTPTKIIKTQKKDTQKTLTEYGEKP